MKILKFFNTPLDTRMVEINLENAEKDERIDKNDIQDALNLLYGTDVKIDSFIANVTTPTLQEDIINDYIFFVNVNGKDDIVLNFACCFLTYKACEKLASTNARENVTECLKMLRGDRFKTHPLYYSDYADKLIEKFKTTALSISNYNKE